MRSLSRANAAFMARHRWYAVLAEIVKEIREDQPALLAKQAAYSLLYAVPSILIVLISLAAIVDRNTGAGVSEALQAFIAERAPAEVQPLLASLVQYAITEQSENAAVVAALLSLAIAIWGGAGGVGALIYAINQVYDIRDTRSFISSIVHNVGLLVLDGVLVIAAILFLTLGRRIATMLPAALGRDSPLVGFFWSSPLWAVGLLFCSVMLLYWFGLDAPKSARWLVPGAVVATLGAVLVIAALDFILTISNPGTAYGAAGSVLILLWTLFVLSAIVVIGAIVNAVLGRHFDRKFIDGLALTPEKRRERGVIAVTEYR
jgi:membrane protein